MLKFKCSIFRMFALLTVCLTGSAVFGQVNNPDADREIIVQYRPDVIKLPAGRTEAAIEELASVDAELRSTRLILRQGWK